MIILNFAHPLTPVQIARVAEMTEHHVEAILDIRVQFDLEAPFAEQTARLIDSLNIDPVRWQSEPFLLALPSLNYISGTLLAELHGRIGHFPAILRLRPAQGKMVTEYEVGEIINLEQIRQSARTRR